jgi:hypothetical protein
VDADTESSKNVPIGKPTKPSAKTEVLFYYLFIFTDIHVKVKLGTIMGK